MIDGPMMPANLGQLLEPSGTAWRIPVRTGTFFLLRFGHFSLFRFSLHFSYFCSCWIVLSNGLCAADLFCEFFSRGRDGSEGATSSVLGSHSDGFRSPTPSAKMLPSWDGGSPFST